MSVNSYVRSAQAVLQKSVAVDVRANETKMENGAQDMEINRERTVKLEAEVKRKAAEAAEKADHGFFGSIAAFFGEDGGAGEAKKELEVTTAALEKNGNLGQVAKQDQQETISRYNDALSQGNQIEAGLKKVPELARNVRQAG